MLVKENNMYKYETTDIWIASALYSLGHSCKAEKVGDKRFVFIFEAENDDEETQIVERLGKLNRKELFVDVQTFQKSYKTLKNLTFNS